MACGGVTCPPQFLGIPMKNLCAVDTGNHSFLESNSIKMLGENNIILRYSFKYILSKKIISLEYTGQDEKLVYARRTTK